VSQKATVTVFSDFRGGKARANAFWRNSLIHNQASHVFSASRIKESMLKIRTNEDLMRNKSNYEGKLNKCVDAEKAAGSRVLLTQHPRPSRFSGHDWR